MKHQHWADILKELEASIKDAPSYRAAKIQIDNLRTLIKKWERDFSTGDFFTDTQDQELLQKRVQQQYKLVDWSIRDLIAEALPGTKPKKL